MSTIEALHDTTTPRVMAAMEGMAAGLRALGWQVNGPYEMSCDSYRWSMLVKDPDGADDTGIDVSIELAEASAYGDDPPDGVNLGLTIVTYGGRILSQFQPFNYTSACWVSASDEKAVGRRWALVLNEGIVAEVISSVDAALNE